MPGRCNRTASQVHEAFRRLRQRLAERVRACAARFLGTSEDGINIDCDGRVATLTPEKLQEPAPAGPHRDGPREPVHPGRQGDLARRQRDGRRATYTERHAVHCRGVGAPRSRCVGLVWVGEPAPPRTHLTMSASSRSPATGKGLADDVRAKSGAAAASDIACLMADAQARFEVQRRARMNAADISLQGSAGRSRIWRLVEIDGDCARLLDPAGPAADCDGSSPGGPQFVPPGWWWTRRYVHCAGPPAASASKRLTRAVDQRRVRRAQATELDADRGSDGDSGNSNEENDTEPPLFSPRGPTTATPGGNSLTMPPLESLSVPSPAAFGSLPPGPAGYDR